MNMKLLAVVTTPSIYHKCDLALKGNFKTGAYKCTTDSKANDIIHSLHHDEKR